MIAQLNASARPALVALQHEISDEAQRHSHALPRLLGFLVDPRNLDAAWRRVLHSSGSDTPGPDGLRARDLARCEPRWLEQLAASIEDGTYRPAPPRLVRLARPGEPGRYRRIGILNVRDRVVQGALLQVLEPLAERIFSNESFAFRPGRSVRGALERAARRLSRGDEAGRSRIVHAATLDVAECFDSLRHATIHNQVLKLTCDHRVLALLDAILAVSSLAPPTAFGWRRRVGVVQGAPLSPLLCNLVLHEIDVALREHVAQTGHGVSLLRYADDLLLIGEGPRLVAKAVRVVRRAAHRLHLTIGACSSILPGREGVDWLGVRLVPRPPGWGSEEAFGYIVPRERIAELGEEIVALARPAPGGALPQQEHLAETFEAINALLRGWAESARHADNAAACFAAIDRIAHTATETLLRQHTGLEGSALRATHRVALGRGFSTWSLGGRSLLVLSSLPPRAPRPAIRKPPWQREDVVQRTAADVEQGRPQGAAA